MDIFKFNNPENATKMEHGEIINGLKSKMWIERFTPAGEFKFVANAHSGVREKLSIGSFVSHIDTREIMIVEDHEIKDARGKETEIVITGRSFETFMEHRAIGCRRAFPVLGATIDYAVPSDYPQDEIVYFIQGHVDTSFPGIDDDGIPYLTVLTDIIGGTPPTAGEVNMIKLGELYSAVLELLNAEKFGIKTFRPGPWKDAATPDGNFEIVIHKGLDKSAEIIFSYDVGEIESAGYLWSNRKAKNCALVFAKWASVRVESPSTTEYNLRMMYIDASSLDNDLSEAPVGAVQTTLYWNLVKRGLAALAAQNDVSLVNPEVSKSGIHAVYRTDYNVGDIIMVDGDYNAASPMIVTEYVEIEDETGMYGYPTLASVE